MCGQSYVKMKKRFKGEDSFLGLVSDLRYLDLENTKFRGKFKKDFEVAESLVLELLIWISSDDLMRQSTAKKLGFEEYYM